MSLRSCVSHTSSFQQYFIRHVSAKTCDIINCWQWHVFATGWPQGWFNSGPIIIWPQTTFCAGQKRGTFSRFHSSPLTLASHYRRVRRESSFGFCESSFDECVYFLQPPTKVMASLYALYVFWHRRRMLSESHGSIRTIPFLRISILRTFSLALRRILQFFSRMLLRGQKVLDKLAVSDVEDLQQTGPTIVTDTRNKWKLLIRRKTYQGT